MRKILFSMIAFAIIGFAVVSCDNDEFTEKDAQLNELELLAFKDSLRKEALKDSLLLRDSLSQLQYMRDSLEKYGVIEYSVKVINASENGTRKSANDAGVDGVDVSISQYGKTITATTDAMGMVSFQDMRIGAVNVTVNSGDYTDVSYIADITPNVSHSTNSSLYTMSSVISVFALSGATNATLEGVVSIEDDLTDSTPELAEGVTIIASIDVDTTAFDKYILLANGYDDENEFIADIEHISYADVWQTTSTDSEGEYSISLPSSPDGVPYNISVSDYVTDQTLYVDMENDVDIAPSLASIRTVYSMDDNASDIPTVTPVKVTIDAPGGSTYRLPTTDAQASAVLTKSGVEAIHITNTGDLYTQAPNVEITSTAYGEGAEATATIDAQGRVNNIVVTAPGIGYLKASTSVALVESAEHADLEAEMVSTVTEITVGAGGSGYTAAPAVTIYPTENGATATATMTSIVDAINITNGGSNYTQVPDVIVAGGGGTGATATAVLSTYGPIAAVDITSTPANYPYYLGTPTINVTFNSTFGNGANGTCVLGTTGRVQTITMSNNGAGYDIANPPAVTVGGDGSGALAVVLPANMSDDGTGNGTYQIDAITIYNDGTTVHYGSGYTSASIVVASPPASAWADDADATANIAFPLESITMNNAGNQYDAGTAIILSTAPDAGVFSGDVVINKSVESITVDAGGSDFVTAPTVTIIAKDGDTGANATATAALTQTVDAIEITNPGSGFEAGNIIVSIAAPPAGGTQATASVTATQDILEAVNVLEGGSGYTDLPYLNPEYTWIDVNDPDNMEAEFTIDTAANAITAVNVANAGYGFSAVTFAPSTYRVQATASVETNPEAGKIEQINITVPGAGYDNKLDSILIVEISDLDGTVIKEAKAIARVKNGSVVDVIVEDGGEGYYKTPAIKFVVPNYSTTAVYTAIVDNYGTITGFDQVDAGMGYDTIPNVTIEGLTDKDNNVIGAGAKAEAVVSEGKVTSLALVNGGAGYVAQNRPGTFGKTATIVDAAGENGETYNYSGAGVTNYVAGGTYVIDYYLGTGTRTDDYAAGTK